MEKRNYSEITPEITALSALCDKNKFIEPEMYTKLGVCRGLRDLNGKGVLTGLTEISEVKAKETNENGERVPCAGQLFYRGYDVKDLIRGCVSTGRFGFEETTYLLLFGNLPTETQLSDFRATLSGFRSLPSSFVRDLIMKAPSANMMNSLARSVLTMYSYDTNPDDTSIPNVLRQSLQLIAMFPMMSVYGYLAYDYYLRGNPSFFIHEPVPELSTAENFLHMLRIDSSYTELEAKVLDIALVLHAEHGGGNNSTFTTRVVTSSLTDTYSAVAAALGSLKGPRHGGANIKVCEMMADMKKKLPNWQDEGAIRDHLSKLLRKEEFDKAGLIYGLGHAVYSVSDPRAEVLRGYVQRLAVEKGLDEEFALYSSVERLAPEVIASERKIYKGVSANVDFYSGFVYNMLGIPVELFTPIFAMSRISGWSAHRLEELAGGGKIIRPAYQEVHPRRDYVPMENR